jgi:hypothetical protein
LKNYNQTTLKKLKMSKIVFFDELTPEAQRYAKCLKTMKKSIELKTPMFKKHMTRAVTSKFKKLLPELQIVMKAMENGQYFPSGPVSKTSDFAPFEDTDNILEFSFKSDYSVDAQKIWWSPTSPVHTVMFGGITEPIEIEQNELDVKLEK